MKTPRSLLSVALGVAVIVVVAAGLGGFAQAAGKTIGKNLVVTKSIKNDAVTGKKVKNGSLTAADLAPGTIPVAGNGKSAAFASTVNFSPNANASYNFTPFGPHTINAAYGALAPTNLSVADFHVVTDVQAAGASVGFFLVTAPTFGGSNTPVLSCTVATGQSSCSSTSTGTIPAGNVFWMIASNGPTGPSTSFAAVAYTIKVD